MTAYYSTFRTVQKSSVMGLPSSYHSTSSNRRAGLELTTDWVSRSVCRFWCFSAHC